MLNAKDVWFRPLLRFAVNGKVPESREEAKALGIVWKRGARCKDYEAALATYKRTMESMAMASRLGL